MNKRNLNLIYGKLGTGRVNSDKPVNMPKFYYADQIEMIRSESFMWGWISGCAVTGGIIIAMAHWGII